MNRPAFREPGPHAPIGVPFGFRELYTLTGGLQPGTVTVIGGQPGVGKSGFLLSMLLNTALAYGLPVGIFDLEFHDIPLIERLSAMVAWLDTTAMRLFELAEEEKRRQVLALALLRAAPILVGEVADNNLLTLLSEMEAMAASDTPPRWIGIDYVQLLQMPYGANRVEEVGETIRWVKSFARRTGIPVVVISSLNRGVEDRTGNIPLLRDLRQSGELAEVPDMVLFLRQHPEHVPSEFPTVLMECLVGKHRSGGEVRLVRGDDGVSFLEDTLRMPMARNRITTAWQNLATYTLHETSAGNPAACGGEESRPAGGGQPVSNHRDRQWC